MCKFMIFIMEGVKSLLIVNAFRFKYNISYLRIQSRKCENFLSYTFKYLEEV